ncbi:MAG TPA: SemiSWEET family transporter [Kofleriaceae bacterium]|nr:SemiSWEET family transporter [Kofleriaceae bacterium]
MTLAIGLFAAALTITSFLAQTWKILKTRDTKSLSAPMWMLSTTAFAIWIAYGVMLGEWPIVIPNALCFLLAGFILTLKLLPRPKRDKVAETITSAVSAES